MRCPIETQENGEILLDYCARKLDPARTSVLEQHIETCPACREFRDRQISVLAALESWELGPPSVDFNRRLWRRVEIEESRGWWSRLRIAPGGSLWRPAVPMAAALVIFFGAALLRTTPHPPAVPTSESTAVIAERLGVDLVERTLEDIDSLIQFDFVAAMDSSPNGNL